MAKLLLIDDDPGTLCGFEMVLRAAGHHVATASSGRQGFDVLADHKFDLILSDLRLPDMSGLDILRRVRDRSPEIPFVVITGFGTTQDAVAAMRLGASDFVEKPLFDEELLRTVDMSLAADGKKTDRSAVSAYRPPLSDHELPVDSATAPESHAASRLVRALLPVLDAANDPRSVSDWSRLAFTSPGALRNWCRTAGIPARRSLVFARLLRVTLLSRGGLHKPENLLDIVDRRTLDGLLRYAGLDPRSEFPTDIDAFLNRQILVRDPATLAELRRALVSHHRSGAPAGSKSQK